MHQAPKNKRVNFLHSLLSLFPFFASLCFLGHTRLYLSLIREAHTRYRREMKIFSR